MSTVHSEDLLVEILRIVKPNGRLYLSEVVMQVENNIYRTKDKLLSLLKLSGYVNVSLVRVELFLFN